MPNVVGNPSFGVRTAPRKTAPAFGMQPEKFVAPLNEIQATARSRPQNRILGAPSGGSTGGGGTMSGPGTGEQFFGETKDFYTSPTRTGDFWKQNKDFFADPTTASTIFETEGSAFFTPGQGETFASGMAPGMAGPGLGQGFALSSITGKGGMTGGANQAQQAWDQFQRNRPDISKDAGLDPYYENAKRRASEDIRQNMASAGAYGSSATADQTAEAMMNLNSEQANREAQYGLQRLAEQRGWEGLGGQLAGQASGAQLGWMTGLGNLGLGAEGLDITRGRTAADIAMGADRLGLDRLTGGMGAAFGVDAGDLSRIMGGIQGAGAADLSQLNRITAGQAGATGAQTLGETRGMNEFTKPFMLGQAGSAIMAPGFENLFTSEQQFRDAAAAAGLGQGLEAIRGERAGPEAFWNDLNQPLQYAGNVYSMSSGMGGMGGGGQPSPQAGGMGYGNTGLMNPWGY